MESVLVHIGSFKRFVFVDPRSVGEKIIQNLPLNSPAMYFDIGDAIGRRAAERPEKYVSEIGNAVLRNEIYWGHSIDGECEDCENIVSFCSDGIRNVALTSDCTCENE